MTGVLAAEWLKTRTVRSTYGLLALVLLMVGGAALLAWYATAVWDGLAPADRDRVAVGPLAPLTGWVAQLCLAVLGALAITAEYGSGAIATTLVAVPQRVRVLAAKAVVVAALAWAAGTAAVFATFAANRLIVGDRPIRGQPDGPVAGELPALLADGAAVVMFALLGLALGTIMRSAVAAIATLAALWYVLPILTNLLPGGAGDWLGSLLPGGLAGQLAGGGGEGTVFGGMLSPAAAGVVMVLYAAVPLAAAGVVFTRREA